jgi:hypothetical protein
MVTKKNFSLKDLAALPGVGESRIKQYSAEFLKALNEARSDMTQSGADVAEELELK